MFSCHRKNQRFPKHVVGSIQLIVIDGKVEGIAIGIIDYEEDEMVQEDLSSKAITNPRRSP